MYLADPVDDPKTADQVLMEVMVLLEGAPEPVASPGDRLSPAKVIRLPEHHEHDDLDDLEVPDPLSRETPA